MYLFQECMAQDNEMAVVLKTITTKHSTSNRHSIQQTFCGHFMDVLQGGPRSKGTISAYYIKGWEGGVVNNEVVLNSMVPGHDANGME